MEIKPISLLIVEDCKIDCNNFKNALANRKDIKLIGMTDSDIEALKVVRFKHPDAIILDIELHNSTTGNPDSFEFLTTLNSNEFETKPLIIVTTHLKSEKTYSLIHNLGADLIIYKDHSCYSSDYVLNKVLTYTKPKPESEVSTLEEDSLEKEAKLSKQIYHELDLVGISPKMVGRQYLHDAILYLLTTMDQDPQPIGAVPYLIQLHGKSSTAITNGIQNAIIRAWKITSIEELELHYTSKVSYETCLPTPMDFIYNYVDKLKPLL